MISYDKGCSVLLMLADVLGYNSAGAERHFESGLQRYLQQHAFGNAASGDLWAALQAEAPPGLPVAVADLMGRYTSQVGYPLITLSYDSARPLQLTATQTRFLMLPFADQDAELRDAQSRLRWDVLLRYLAQGGVETSTWMLATDGSAVLERPAGSEWVLVNSGRFGYYRVNYPPELWTALAVESRREEAPFSNSELCGLLDDVWTLALAGNATYASAFDMTSFLATTAFGLYTPWSVALTQLGRLSRLLSAARPDAAARLSTFIVTRLISGNPVAQPPWTSAKADHMRALLQQLFVSALVAHGDTSARALALQLFDSSRAEGGPAVPVDIRDAVYRVGVEEGGAAAWDALYEQFRASLDSGESRRILRALTRSPDPGTLRRLLDWSSDTARIKSQDQSRVVIYVALNPKGRDIAWQWVKGQWQKQCRSSGLVHACTCGSRSGFFVLPFTPPLTSRAVAGCGCLPVVFQPTTTSCSSASVRRRSRCRS